MKLYCGIDLHAKNSYLATIDNERKRIFNRNVTNDRQTILSFLAPYRTINVERAFVLLLLLLVYLKIFLKNKPHLN